MIKHYIFRFQKYLTLLSIKKKTSCNDRAQIIHCMIYIPLIQ